jgi:DNA-directed RNA polymerase subunit alpha
MTPGTIEIVNPNLSIATLDSEQAHLVMDLVVETGRGFVSADQLAEQKPEQPVGVILIDAIYSPVLHVNFTLEEVERGRDGNFERIVLSITTDETISPDEALRQSADILQRQFVVLASHPYEIPEKPTHLSDTSIPRYIYTMDIENLRLSLRAVNALRRVGIRKVGQILEMSEEDLITIRNFGQKSLLELCECLMIRGFLPKSK